MSSLRRRILNSSKILRKGKITRNYVDLPKYCKFVPVFYSSASARLKMKATEVTWPSVRGERGGGLGYGVVLSICGGGSSSGSSSGSGVILYCTAAFIAV